MGSCFKKKQKNKIAKVWIADCGDPFMGQENDTFKYPFYFKYVEKWFMKKTDFVSVPTVGAISAYYPEFKDKIKVIPQGFDFNFYFKTEDKHNDNVPTFGYAGTLIRGRRDPKEFIAYILSLKTDFIFYVYTKNTDLIEPFLQQSKGRVILKSLVPREKLLQELSQLDFVVNFENVGNKQTPSKLIDYVIINKPILSIKTGNLNIDIINEFLAGNYNNKFIVNNHDQYRIENVCKQFLNLVKD
ncbi:MAG: hypothetical protein IPN31_05855 [Bacteroidetes bacterium]|nr:hypothetical protein [Bacteroidota bacterium]